MSPRWPDYIDAAHRKIAITAFHYDQLKAALAHSRDNGSGRPDIPVQAFFEGVVTAAISAVDQVAQAANSALGLGAGNGNLFDIAAPAIEARVPCFREWRERPIGRDLRRLRARIVHYSYVKSPTADRNWQVEVTDQNYQGPRSLLDYAEATVAYANELGIITDKLADSLTSNSAAAS